MANELQAEAVLPEDVVREAMPEEIRQADEFLSTVRKFLEFIRARFQIPQVRPKTLTPLGLGSV